MKIRSSILAATMMILPWSAQALEPWDASRATRWPGVEVIKPEDAQIGKQIGNLPFHDLWGRAVSLHDLAGERGTVVVVRDPKCPVSRRYGPRISQLGQGFVEKGFSFVFIYLNESLKLEALEDDARGLRLPQATMVGKGSFVLAAALGVRSTGDVFVLDDEYRLIYRGAIDDQYGFGYTQEAPTHHYLRNALEAELREWPVPVPATLAPGCQIDADPAKDELLPIPPGAALS